jgi:hypothetical protein
MFLGLPVSVDSGAACRLSWKLKIYKLLYVLGHFKLRVATTINDMWQCHVEPYLGEAYQIFL